MILTMDKNYDFIRCEESYLQELPPIVNKQFQIESNEKYFERRYFGNPAGKAFSVVVLFNGKVVGLLSSMPTKYSVGGEEVIGVQEADLVIMEEYRRLDVYLRFLKFYIDLLLKHNIKFALGFTNDNSYSLDLTGSSMISPVPRLVKILNVRPFIEEKIHNKYISAIPASFCNALLRTRYPMKHTLPDGLQLRIMERFDHRIDKLWQQYKNDYPVMTVRDSEYLNWRYADSPIKKYEIACLEHTRTNDIRGFVVLGHNKMNGLLRGQIQDIVVPRTENHALTKCLLEYAIGRFAQMKADVVDCWMLSHCHIYGELIRMGFILREKKSMHFHVKQLKHKDPSISHDVLKNIGNWYLTSGDFNSI